MIELGAVISVAQQIVALCQQASETRAVLKSAGRKVESVRNCLQQLPNGTRIDKGTLVSLCEQMKSVLTVIQKVKRMNKVVYLAKAKSIAQDIEKLVDEIRFYVGSLTVSQVANVQRSLDTLDESFDQTDQDLLKDLQQEQRKGRDLQRKVTQQERIAIATQSELDLARQQLKAEEQRLRQLQDHKAQQEAQYMSQLINALSLQSRSANRTLHTPDAALAEFMYCPISAESMAQEGHDPVHPDCSSCCQTCSRKALTDWLSLGKKTCPLCNSPLRSNRMRPNASLRAAIQHQHRISAVSQKAPPPSPSQPLPSSSRPNNSTTRSTTEILQRQRLQAAAGAGVVKRTPQQALSNSVQPLPSQKALTKLSTTTTPMKYTVTKTLKGHSNWVRCCAVYDGGSKIVSGSADKTLKVWDIKSGTCYQTLKGHSKLVLCCDVFDGGGAVVSGSGDKTLKLWDVELEGCLKTMKGHKDLVFSCVLLEDGSKIVSGSWDKTLKVWSVNTGRCLKTMKGHSQHVNCCAALDGGSKVVSGSADYTLKVWSVETGRCLQTMKGHQHSVNCCIGLDDGGGSKIVSGSNDWTLKVWDANTGLCLQTMKGHSGSVLCCAAVLDDGGSKIVSGCGDKTLKVWNVETGLCLQTLQGHSSDVYCCTVLLNHHGSKIVSGSGDKTLKVWELR